MCLYFSMIISKGLAFVLKKQVFQSCIKVCTKKIDWAKYVNRHSSKSISVIKLSFCQNDFPMGETFWQKDSLITQKLFELWLIMIFRPVANFAQQSLVSFQTKKIWENETCFIICLKCGNCCTLVDILACSFSQVGPVWVWGQRQLSSD